MGEENAKAKKVKFYANFNLFLQTMPYGQNLKGNLFSVYRLAGPSLD